jgi:hypothetical protein
VGITHLNSFEKALSNPTVETVVVTYLKKALEGVSKKEARSVAQLCEAMLEEV